MRFFAADFGAGDFGEMGACRRCRGAFTSQPSSKSFFESAMGALGDLVLSPRAAPFPCTEDERFLAADLEGEGLSMRKGGSGALAGNEARRRGRCGLRCGAKSTGMTFPVGVDWPCRTPNGWREVYCSVRRIVCCDSGSSKVRSATREFLHTKSNITKY